MRVSKIIDANNYTVGFVTEYPDHAVIEKTVAYGYELNKELKITELGRLTVYLRNGEQYTFDCWVSTIYCGQFGINVSDDGQYIYVISDEKGLWCYTYKGEIVWKTRYTSVGHIIINNNNTITCITSTKLLVLDENGKLVNERRIVQYHAEKASENMIYAAINNSTVALIDSQTLNVLWKSPLKKLGLEKSRYAVVCGDSLEIRGENANGSVQYITVELPNRE